MNFIFFPFLCQINILTSLISKHPNIHSHTLICPPPPRHSIHLWSQGEHHAVAVHDLCHHVVFVCLCGLPPPTAWCLWGVYPRQLTCPYLPALCHCVCVCGCVWDSARNPPVLPFSICLSVHYHLSFLFLSKCPLRSPSLSLSSHCLSPHYHCSNRKQARDRECSCLGELQRGGLGKGAGVCSTRRNQQKQLYMRHKLYSVLANVTLKIPHLFCLPFSFWYIHSEAPTPTFPTQHY